MTVGTENPYVGPVAFSEADSQNFFGREREAENLAALVASNRLTLFYAPSGAGKSSLIHARLIPMLRSEEHFSVLPVARVGVSAILRSAAVDANIFVLNLISWLDTVQTTGAPASLPPPNHLHDTYANLSDFLGHHLALLAPSDPDHGSVPLLIIDQFEEILTTYASRWQECEHFFDQLAMAMHEHQTLWVVLSMREEYVGTLERYAWRLPGKLRTRFYMRRLSHEAALEAIRQPAANHQRPFADGVAERLVQDLAQIRIEGQRGATVTGEFVEPIQLQVVCKRLWENLQTRPPGPITDRDLTVLGDVNEALAQFYDEALAIVLRDAAPSVTEFKVRHWFSNQLITQAGTRGTVFEGESETGGLDNRAVAEFERLRLIRGEPRAGGKWYELVHDRFIEPILAANRQRQTQLTLDMEAWLEAGKNPHKLYAGKQAAEAAAQIEANPSQFSDSEREFVDAAIDRGLAIHYEQVITALARDPELQISEFQLRRWFSELITPTERTRKFIHQGESESGGLPNPVVDRLQEQGLVRRRATTEGQLIGLVRDSFVVPILLANSDHLTPLDEDAEQWRAAGKDPQRLYTGAKVSDAVAQIERDPTRFSRLEHEFVSAAVAAQQRRERWRVRWVFATGLAVILLLIGFASWVQRNARAETSARATAEAQTTVAAEAQATAVTAQATAEAALAETMELNRLIQANALVANAQTEFELSPPRALLLAIEAIRTHGPGKPHSSAAEQSLHDFLGRSGGQPLVGHTDAVLAVAYSPNGEWLASAGAGGAIHLRAAADPITASMVLTGHIGEVRSLAFSADSQTLASTGADGAVRLWAPHSGTLLGSRQLATPAYGVAFSPDGRLLAIGADGAVHLWDRTTDEELPVLTGHEGMVYAVAFRPDGEWLASAGWDQTIRLWPLAGAETEPSLFQGHTSAINALSFAPDGRRLASASDDGAVLLWDVASGQELRRFDHEQQVLAVAISPDGHWLASGRIDGRLNLWEDFENPMASPAVLRGHEAAVKAIAFRRDSRQLASGSIDTSVRLWRVTSPMADPRLLTAHEGEVNKVTFSPNRTQLASAGADGRIFLWSMDDLLADPPAFLSQAQTIWSLAFSPDGRYLASTDGNALHLTEVATNVVSLTLAAGEAGEGELYAVAFSSDRQWLAGAGDGGIWLWPLADLTSPPTVLPNPVAAVWSLAFSPDSKWLASASDDGQAHLWALDNPSAAPQLILSSPSPLWSVAYSADERWFSSAGADGVVRLWSAAALRLPRPLRGHDGPVWQVAMSTDGQWLASAGNDQTVRLWATAPVRREPILLQGHTSPVNTVAFNLDGTWIASGGRDQTIRLWTLNIERLVALACRTAGRNLTEEEWTQYFEEEPYRQTCPAP